MTKEEIKNYVVILQNHDAPIRSVFTSDINQYKVRMIVGYKVFGMDSYYFEKMGNVFTITAEESIQNNNIFDEKVSLALDIALTMWLKIRNAGHWRKTIDLFGYHFGMDYSVDEDERIIGDWPVVATMTINADDVFLLDQDAISSPGLPERYRDLKFFDFPKPTGRCLNRAY